MSSQRDEVELLKKKIEREKKARELAESQLEVYSREIYLTNQRLVENLEKVDQRRKQLEFLHIASNMVNSELSLTDLLKSITSFISTFVEAKAGGFYFVNENLNLEQEKALVWTSDQLWHEDGALFDIFSQNVLLEGTLNAPKWIRTRIKDKKTELAQSDLLIYKNYSVNKKSIAVLAFLCCEELITDEIIFVLDTVHDHLMSGLRRRLADEGLLRRNKQLEETIFRLESTQQQLIQSEKMASLGLLSAGVAHEINNPIGYIKANLEVLNDYHDSFRKCYELVVLHLQQNQIDPKNLLEISDQFDISFLLEDSQEILKTNLEGIKRVSEIVNGLKTYSHSGDNKQTLMSLSECVESALRVVNNELKYQHKVENKLTEELPKIMGNSGQLQQVFINLFVNAAHAMPEGGELSIDADVTEEPKMVIVYVTDTGVGMTDEQKNKLFVPFYTTKPVGSGTGLGLSVSMAILEAHNTKIAVESDIGLGSTFILSFPIPD